MGLLLGPVVVIASGVVWRHATGPGPLPATAGCADAPPVADAPAVADAQDDVRNGNRASMRVPAPGRDDTLRLPPTASTR